MTASGMSAHAFDDRSVSLDSPEQLVQYATVLSSATRVAVLTALTRAKDALNINEVARRVGVNASPVRTHLELLARAGIVDEVGEPGARERRFRTRLTNIRLTLEGVDRISIPAARGPVPKAVARIERKLAAMDREMATLRTKAARLRGQIEAAWERAADDPSGA